MISNEPISKTEQPLNLSGYLSLTSLKNIFCKNDLVICAHINFVPLAILISLLNRSKTVLVCYGVDVWSTHQSFIVRKMLRYIDRFWSISDITKRKMIECRY